MGLQSPIDWIQGQQWKDCISAVKAWLANSRNMQHVGIALLLVYFILAFLLRVNFFSSTSVAAAAVKKKKKKKRRRSSASSENGGIVEVGEDNGEMEVDDKGEGKEKSEGAATKRPSLNGIGESTHSSSSHSSSRHKKKKAKNKANSSACTSTKSRKWLRKVLAVFFFSAVGAITAFYVATSTGLGKDGLHVQVMVNKSTAQLVLLQSSMLSYLKSVMSRGGAGPTTPVTFGTKVTTGDEAEKKAQEDVEAVLMALKRREEREVAQGGNSGTIEAGEDPERAREEVASQRKEVERDAARGAIERSIAEEVVKEMKEKKDVERALEKEKEEKARKEKEKNEKKEKDEKERKEKEERESKEKEEKIRKEKEEKERKERGEKTRKEKEEIERKEKEEKIRKEREEKERKEKEEKIRKEQEEKERKEKEERDREESRRLLLLKEEEEKRKEEEEKRKEKERNELLAKQVKEQSEGANTVVNLDSVKEGGNDIGSPVRTAAAGEEKKEEEGRQQTAWKTDIMRGGDSLPCGFGLQSEGTTLHVSKEGDLLLQVDGKTVWQVKGSKKRAGLLGRFSTKKISPCSQCSLQMTSGGVLELKEGSEKVLWRGGFMEKKKKATKGGGDVAAVVEKEPVFMLQLMTGNFVIQKDQEVVWSAIAPEKKKG